jgi:hypothetical protein
MSEATANGAPGLVTRNLGVFLLLGKKTTIRVHEPFGFGGLEDGEKQVLVAEFAAALGLFEGDRFDDSERAFAEILVRFPDDGPSAFYVGLSATYRREGRRWGGAISVAVK